MSFVFEQLDYQTTPLGDISLRKRTEIRLNNRILYEVILGNEFLMSSLFTEAEIQLSKLALAKFAENELDVVVGGLGLGYTAAAALEFPSVRSLQVVEVMAPVIDWHQRGLVPLGKELTDDARCTLVHQDFFDVAMSNNKSFDGSEPCKQVHAVLLDIDHSPSNWLNASNSSFYSIEGLQSIYDKLHPGGIFGLWSNDYPEDYFILLLNQVFDKSESHIIKFPNPYVLGTEVSNSVYLAFKAKE
jgi:spermidine synthase